jgi:hypothetical protein
VALIVADRILETSTSTGTGNFALAGAVSGYRDFDSVCANADTCYYTIEAVDGNGNPSGDWEVGLGTFNDTDTLVRTTPAASSNGGAAVNFAAGSKRVMLNATAGYLATKADVSALTAKASATQTAEQISGFIASPSNKSYTVALKMAHAGTITETTTISVSGTCTATFKVNSTALGGTANSVSSSEQSQSHSSTNTFAAGDDIVLTVSSNSTCVDMSFTIKYTRTLA